jgi:hypothetical protein
MQRIQDPAGQLLVGDAFSQQTGYELLGQSRRFDPYPSLDPGVLAREFRPQPRFTH